VALNFNTLTIINGIIDEAIQSTYYPGKAFQTPNDIVRSMLVGHGTI
jgi:hypothetical protein